MFRSLMPAMTLVVFGIGMGIGLAFSRGWLPVALTPVNSGRLGIEITAREPLPPPPDDDAALAPHHRRKPKPIPVDDPEVFEKQSEPGDHSPNVVTADASNDAQDSFTVPASGSTEENTSDRVEQTDLTNSDSSGQSRFRAREKAAVRLDQDAGIEDASTPAANQRVTTTAHQDPTEDANASRESNETTKSPQERLAAAEEKLAAGDTLSAHRDLSKLYWNHKEFRPRLQEVIDSTAKAIFFLPKPHYVDPYVIQEGDRLQTIAKKYQLSWEYLAKLNRTDPRRVQVGQKLKVMKGPFGAVVDLSDFALTIHLQGYYVKRYDVGIGKENSSPIGKFAVLGKLENPQYTDSRTGKVTEGDDPSNPLGERWIDLGDGYGIHGTIEPDSIGKAESRGCIRLRDEDIVEVYNFLVKGSEVVIRK